MNIIIRTIVTTLLLIPSISSADVLGTKAIIGATIAEAAVPTLKGTVDTVVDGDTVRVKIDGVGVESVRLIGIDTPESRDNKKARKDAERSGSDLNVILEQGKKATEHLRAILPKDTAVKLESDVQSHDRYGRRLAYIYLTDGTMLNEKMVRDGYANLMTYPPNVKHVEKFRAAHRDARENERGLFR